MGIGINKNLSQEDKTKLYKSKLEKINKDIEVIGDYVDTKTKIRLRCKNLHEWDTKPMNPLEGKGCPICSGKYTNTISFVEKMEKINNNIEILSEYINAKTKIKCRCLLDNYEWNATPNQLLSGKGCPKCSKRIRYTHDDFVSIIEDKFDGKIKIKSKYNGQLNSLNCECLVCGNEWTSKHARLVFVAKTTPCINCAAKIRGEKSRDTEADFISKLSKITDNITLVGKYELSSVKTEFYCNICESYFKEYPAKILVRNGKCPCCGLSKGEKKIFEYLKKHNIEFEREYSFHDLFSDNGTLLRYDFAIIKNNSVNKIIEFDGVFHYEKVYPDHDLEKQQRYDEIKNNYCSNHNIEILRIPYWNYENIEKILDDFLNNKNFWKH